MSPGRTRTGGVLERMVLPALDEGGYAWRAQVSLGMRLGVGAHKVDAVAEKDGRKILPALCAPSNGQAVGTAKQHRCDSRVCLVLGLWLRDAHVALKDHKYECDVDDGDERGEERSAIREER